MTILCNNIDNFNPNMQYIHVHHRFDCIMCDNNNDNNIIDSDDNGDMKEISIDNDID